MIADLLPEYYKSHGNNTIHKVIKSKVVDGHEVAWMEFRGMTGKRPYSGRMLQCECYFTKDIGWRVKGGKTEDLYGPEKCSKRKEAVRLRHLELQKEYLKRFKAGNNLFVLRQHIPEIVSDLIKKVKAGEFLEDGNGASFWGGYFYLQTLVAIVDPSLNFWQVGDSLVKAKKISLEGAVVQEYRKPSPPRWEPSFEVKSGTWVGIALLPTHRDVPQAWRLTVTDSSGKIVCTQSLPMQCRPDFGVDVSDFENAKLKLRKLLAREMKKRRK